jgi:hypothetical protein
MCKTHPEDVVDRYKESVVVMKTSTVKIAFNGISAA